MRKILALTLSSSLLIQPSALQANPAVGAMCAVPGAGWMSCTVLGAAGAGLIVVALASGQRLTLPRGAINFNPSGNYQRHRYPQVKPGPRPSRYPSEMRASTKVQVFGVTSPDRCHNVVKRLQRHGYKARLVRARRNNIGSGGVLQWVCDIETNAPDDFYFSFGGRD